jgi:putative DNA-invertase from lambdoid prophage Rac
LTKTILYQSHLASRPQTGFLDTPLPRTMTPRAALYARVSTADQQTLPLQIAAMREYAERRGWSVVASIEDVGSGAKDRPRRAALIKMAGQRKVDVILVWRLDRWGRSLSDLIETLRDITAIGVDFASVTEGLDLSTPTGRAMVGMLSVFAQFEREVLVERVRAGLNLARKKGKILGRPSTARDQADKIRKLALEGLNKTQIAKRLKVGRASVFRALAQEPSGA